MKNCIVSIIIPCYNNEKYIAQAIESALNQTYKAVEVIVVNDGSSDGSINIINNYTHKIIVVSQENKGGAAARNAGLRKAKGKYVKFLDGDDYLCLSAIEKEVEINEQLSKNEIVFGDYKRVNIQNEILKSQAHNRFTLIEKDSLAFFIRFTDVVTSCPLHRKDLLDTIGGFNETLIAGQEVDLHFRLTLSGVKFIRSNHQSYFYRQHNTGTRISSTGWVRRKPELGWNQLEYMESAIVNKFGSLSKLQRKSLTEKHLGYCRSLLRVENIQQAKIHFYSAIRISKFKVTFNSSIAKGYLMVFYLVFEYIKISIKTTWKRITKKHF